MVPKRIDPKTLNPAVELETQNDGTTRIARATARRNTMSEGGAALMPMHTVLLCWSMNEKYVSTSEIMPVQNKGHD
jgi:hypothetical protein